MTKAKCHKRNRRIYHTSRQLQVAGRPQVSDLAQRAMLLINAIKIDVFDNFN